MATGRSAAVHNYAVHPMSTYGGGKVFRGFSRPGAGGDAAGAPGGVANLHDGMRGQCDRRQIQQRRCRKPRALAAACNDAMEAAWQNTQRTALTDVGFMLTQMPLGARNTPEHTEAVLRKRLAEGVRPFDRSEAAMGLAWYERVKKRRSSTAVSVKMTASVLPPSRMSAFDMPLVTQASPIAASERSKGRTPSASRCAKRPRYVPVCCGRPQRHLREP